MFGKKKKKAVKKKEPLPNANIIDSAITINEYRKGNGTRETSINISVTIEGVLSKTELVKLVTDALHEQE